MPDSSTPKLEFILVPHTHWDREWYLPFESFRHRLVRLLDRLAAIMEADPEYRFFHLDGQTIVLEDYEEIRGPHAGLRRLIQEGRIQIGPWYILPDEFLVSGESIIRNLQEGFRVAAGFGVEPVPIGYLPDMFGHIAQMPQILAGFGLDNAVVWRGIGPELTRNQFWWLALDGSRVFSAFLPLGYGFAFALPENPKRLLERLQFFLLALKQNETTGVMLLPNGTDHWEPQAQIPQTLQAAQKLKPEWKFEMGNFPIYLQRLRERASNLPSHSGELRSPARAQILPSVASARLYLKQLDFSAAALLERYLEPLAVQARTLAGPDLRDHFRYLWRLLLQNHPHDSICGCSVDAVHQEMETRYAKLNQLSERLLGEALAVIAEKVAGPGPRLCAWNPNAAPGLGPLRGEVEMRLPANPILVPASGEAVPLQAERIQREEVVFEVTVPKIAAPVALEMLAVEEQIGGYLVGYRLKRRAKTLVLTAELGSRRTAIDLAGMKLEVESKLKDPKLALIQVQVARLPRYRVAANLPARPGLSIRSFEVRKGKTGPVSTRLTAGPEFLENSRWRVGLEKAGRLSLTHQASGLTFSGLRFLDLGDRGDEYNFDPVADDVAVTEPVAVRSRLLSSGPALAELELHHRFRLPAGLEPDRKRRSRRTVPLDLLTRISLGEDAETVEFRTAFANRAEDHRLQVAFDAPFATDQYLVETAFGAVLRPIQLNQPPKPPGPLDFNAMLMGAEGTYSTSPQKTYAAISDGSRGMALFNRGLAEVEAVRLDQATRLALTLVRGIGWLSRPDLRLRTQHAGPPMRTPGAECRRDFVCEYALAVCTGSAETAGIAAPAHAFAFPPLLFTAPGSGSGLADRSLIQTDNPNLELSAFFPVAADAGELRLYNTSSAAQTCRLSWDQALSAEGVRDLRGRKVAAPEVKLTPGSAEIKFRPYQIITLRFTWMI